MHPVAKPTRCLLVLLCVASEASGQVTMDWVTVGNPGNAADPATGFGSVDYEYRIGATEVTNDQYAAFLNAKSSSDPFLLYDTRMSYSARGGIVRSGVDGKYVYAVKPNMGNKPVNYVNWYDAARMANWLTNGQGDADTESGTYILSGTYAVDQILREYGSPRQIFLPNESEWYKAAYHQDVAAGGDIDNYWLFATQSNSTPVPASSTVVGDIANPGFNVVNYLSRADWNGLDGNVTSVGSAGNASFYGAFDMNGNVWEWVEVEIQQSWGISRGLRGGSQGSFENQLQSTYRYGDFPPMQIPNVGFRLAAWSPCPADLAAPFGTLNVFDIIEFIALYNAQDPAADLAAPIGSFNIFDVQAYLGLYNAGCP